jgi:hypothetical protein
MCSVHIFIHLPQAVLVEKGEGLAASFIIVKPADASLKSQIVFIVEYTWFRTVSNAKR